MTTAKESCNILISLLVKHKITNVVISPGSRNAPLIIAASRHHNINCHVIVDERSAAFVALGMCATTNGDTPVALICTSGTALLNYSPAIAEAYYRNMPLIVISADRPAEWIDQDDSQTLRQFEALGNYVKSSYNIPSRCEDDNTRWYINRMINDAIISSSNGKRGPVHINIQLDEPLNVLSKNYVNPQRVISTPDIQRTLSSDFCINAATEISNSKVLIICGFQNEQSKYWHCAKEIDELISQSTNIVYLTESISNEQSFYAINNIDRVLSSMTVEEKNTLKPDIVITYGGALISRHIKQYLRQYKPQQHWHIGLTDTTIDCFQALTTRIELRPNEFFKQITSEISSRNSKTNISESTNYSLRWNEITVRARDSHNQYINNIGWCDMKAFSHILPQINGTLHLSNGTAIRYQQLFDQNKQIKSVYCNRGVSGIDGSTSTAIGNAMLTSETLVLITGDLSAQYDIGALSINNIPSTFKMIVMCNGGGGIFRFIKSTSDLPELEEYFAIAPNLPLELLAKGYGFNFFKACNEPELIDQLPLFLKKDKKPSILAVYTPAKESAQILKDYFKR